MFLNRLNFDRGRWGRNYTMAKIFIVIYTQFPTKILRCDHCRNIQSHEFYSFSWSIFKTVMNNCVWYKTTIKKAFLNEWILTQGGILINGRIVIPGVLLLPFPSGKKEEKVMLSIIQVWIQIIEILLFSKVLVWAVNKKQINLSFYLSPLSLSSIAPPFILSLPLSEDTANSCFCCCPVMKHGESACSHCSSQVLPNS